MNSLLPDSQLYEAEIQYMPYKKALEEVANQACKRSPRKASVLDLMCGPGYLLGQLLKARPDLDLHGVDIDERYVAYARKKYPTAQFELGDVLTWTPSQKYDLVLCTGSCHHLEYDNQSRFISRIPEIMQDEGICIFGDCYIDDYCNEAERAVAAARLGFEYLKATIENGAPKDVILETAKILVNDVMLTEFKTSFEKRRPVFDRAFRQIEAHKTWPDTPGGFGDYYVIATV